MTAEKIAAHIRELAIESSRAEQEYHDAKSRIADAVRDLQAECPHPSSTRACAEVEPQCDVCGAEV